MRKDRANLYVNGSGLHCPVCLAEPAHWTLVMQSADGPLMSIQSTRLPTAEESPPYLEALASAWPVMKDGETLRRWLCLSCYSAWDEFVAHGSRSVTRVLSVGGKRDGQD